LGGAILSGGWEEELHGLSTGHPTWSESTAYIADNSLHVREQGVDLTLLRRTPALVHS